MTDRAPTATLTGPPPDPEVGGAPEWLARPWRFTFPAGEVALGAVALRALVLNTPFIRRPADGLEPPLPFERFPESTDVVIAHSHPVAAKLPRVAVLRDSIRYVPAQYRHHYVDLSGTFEDYLGKFSSKSRWTLRKKIAKFAEFSGGSVAWRAFGVEGMDEFHRLAFEVSAKTYQSRLLSSGLPEPGRFRRELGRCTDARGYVLFHEGKPVAFIFCPAREGNLLYEHVGYDPEYQRWSPGSVLQALALEALFAEGAFQTFDFTEGDGDHKKFFANRSVPCADIFYFRKSIRCVFVVGLHAGTLLAGTRASARLLEKFGIRAG